jgi:drug/metabolite transporter (DMT)-like permease
MNWIIVAISAYLLLAVANLLDKFVVDNVLKSSKAYAFAACLLGAIVFLAFPWCLSWPGWPLFLFNILNGFIFAVALWLLYEALRRGEAARILVFIGGVTPVFSLIFSLLFFKEHFTASQWLGMLFILAGVAVIILLPTKRSYLTRVMNKLKLTQNIRTGGLGVAVLSALAYSVYFLSTKQAYSFQPFASAFIWTRLGAALFVLFFLIKRADRQAIKSFFGKASPNKNKFLVVFNQTLGATGFILQNYAIFLGSVVLVNALQGIQYAFLLVIGTILALSAPRLLKETFSWNILIRKTLAVLVIAAGLYFIAF